MAQLTATEVATQASRVRALAVDLLDPTGPDPDRHWANAVAAPVDAWDVFLRSEQIAALFAERLEQVARWNDLPDQVRSLIDKRRRTESLRVLRARAQLAELGRAAAEQGWQVIVLKGGRAILGASNIVLDLADLDVLVPVGTLDAVAAWLDARAIATGASSPDHLATRVIDGALALDVHHTLNATETIIGDGVWDRAEPLATGLLGLSAVEHAWHVVHHATARHFSRRGRLRDLFVLADALRACATAEKQDLHRRARRHRFATSLAWSLEMAESLVNGDPVEDRFAAVAFTRYSMNVITRRARWRHWLEAHQLVDWVFAAQAGREERRALWAQALIPSTETSPYRIIGAVERLSPKVGLLWRRGARLAHRAALSAFAWPIAVRIERAWRRHAIV